MPAPLTDATDRPAYSPMPVPMSTRTTLVEHSTMDLHSAAAGLVPLPILPQKQSKMNGYIHLPAQTSVSETTAEPSSSKASSSVQHSFLPSLVHSGPLLPLPIAPLAGPSTFTSTSAPRPKVVEVQCKARTRVPTPHGPVFLHIYHNNVDNKEHLAIVVDSAQLEYDEDGDNADALSQSFIRSRTLDTKWHEGETEMERLIRGAYVGRLSPTRAKASQPSASTSSTSATPGASSSATPDIPTPIVRIHSECYTGETIGSMRCDCGEQLDEAIRYISQPQPHPSSSLPRRTVPGRGAVIYMRQEGRGIGLLEKIRAYNLQDMGHDTVAANLLLGHGADERGYDVAAAILRDLGLHEEIRLLTNNPDKMEKLAQEGIVVKERLPMVPRTWTAHSHAHLVAPAAAVGQEHPDAGTEPRKAGATMIGGGAAYGVDLEKYLRTKVLRMGHLLELPTPAKPQPGHEIVTPINPPSAFEVELSPVLAHHPLPPRQGL